LSELLTTKERDFAAKLEDLHPKDGGLRAVQPQIQEMQSELSSALKQRDLALQDVEKHLLQVTEMQSELSSAKERLDGALKERDLALQEVEKDRKEHARLTEAESTSRKELVRVTTELARVTNEFARVTNEHAGTQFTSFTTTKVQILTPAGAQSKKAIRARSARG
jgi:chromosome segregation ATPase